nr:RNA-directed DNA polymerase, eukaryota [Tanacetum cinerariifolium]
MNSSRTLKIDLKKPHKSHILLERDFAKRISLEQNDDLEREVSNEKIKRAVWDCGIDKTPGPDGFTFGFYRRYWDIIAWCGDIAFKNLVLILYALESMKNIEVASKLSHRCLEFSFRRNPRGGVEQAQFERLKEMVECVTLSNSNDRRNWSLVGSGDFSVSSVRKLIDNAILPKGISKTRWIKEIPIKINIHAWKVIHDCLPTRFNISRRVFEKFKSQAANNKANLILFLADNDPSTNRSGCPVDGFKWKHQWEAMMLSSFERADNEVLTQAATWRYFLVQHETGCQVIPQTFYCVLVCERFWDFSSCGVVG